MPVLEWTKDARGDLLAIVDYISDDSPEAAQRLLEDIKAKATALLQHPKLYRTGRVAGTREMVVRSDYVVVYREQPHAVTVLRVLHAARQWPSATP